MEAASPGRQHGEALPCPRSCATSDGESGHNGSTATVAAVWSGTKSPGRARSAPLRTTRCAGDARPQITIAAMTTALRGTRHAARPLGDAGDRRSRPRPGYRACSRRSGAGRRRTAISTMTGGVRRLRSDDVEQDLETLRATAWARHALDDSSRLIGEEAADRVAEVGCAAPASPPRSPRGSPVRLTRRQGLWPPVRPRKPKRVPDRQVRKAGAQGLDQHDRSRRVSSCCRSPSITAT